jgi:hypothetical protein
MEYINIMGKSCLLGTRCAKRNYNRVTTVSIQKGQSGKQNISRYPNKVMGSTTMYDN